VTTFHISGRQTGKTHEMIQWLRQHPDGVVLVHSQQAADQFKKQFEDTVRTRFPDTATVIPAGDAKDYFKGQAESLRPVALDNLDLAMREVFGRELDQVTATGHHVVQSGRMTPSRGRIPAVPL
jgi:hypothetical protein